MIFKGLIYLWQDVLRNEVHHLYDSIDAPPPPPPSLLNPKTLVIVPSFKLVANRT